MVSSRTFTQYLLVAALGLSAGAALLSPDTAQAGDGKHKSADPFDCDKTPDKAKLGAHAARYIKACKAANVKTFGDMKDLMKKWKKASDDKELKAAGGSLTVKDCKTCHTDANGMEGNNAEGYKFLGALMDNAGVEK